MLKSILVPIDGSTRSMRGLSLALMIAKATNAKIFAVHVIRRSLGFNFPVSSEITSMHRKNAEQIILDAKMKAKKESVSFVGKILRGENIGKEITKFANNKKIDLIVIGSRGPDPSAEAFLGSVANYILHKSRIPITIVK